MEMSKAVPPLSHVTVPREGPVRYSTAAAPNFNLYFLNYLAGELLDEARATPPFDDPALAWLKNDWAANPMPLPVVGQ